MSINDRLYSYFIYLNKDYIHNNWYAIDTNKLSNNYNDKNNYFKLKELGKNGLSIGLNSETYWLYKDTQIYNQYMRDLELEYIKTGRKMNLKCKNVGKLVESNESDIIYPLSYKWALDINYLEKNNDNNKIVLEIGAGLGIFAHLYCSNTNVNKYFILDIPTTSMISGYLLLCNNYDIVFENEIENINDILENDKKQIIFISPSFLTSFPEESINMIINMDSLVEMNQPIIEFYLNHIKRTLKKDGYFWNSNCSRNKNYPYLLENIQKLFNIKDDFNTTPLQNELYDYDRKPERLNYNFTMDKYYRNILCSI